MANIATLVVSLGANSAKLITGLKKSTSAVQKWAKDIKKKAESAAKFLSPVGAALRSITKIAAAGVGAVGGFFAAMTVKTNAIKEIENTARAFGVSTKALQEWQYAANSVGLEGDKIGDIFKDISDKINDFVLTGGGGAADIFEQLKLDAKDFIGLAPDKALLKINQAMQGITQGEKIFFLEALAGDAAKLLPLLDGNAEGFKKLAEQAQKTGNVLSQDQIDGAVQFSNAMKEATSATSGFLSQIAGNLAEPLSEVVRFIQDELIGNAFGGVQSAARMASSWIVGFVRDTIETFANISSVWTNVVGGVDGIKAAFLRLHQVVIDTVGTIAQLGVILTPSVWGKQLGLNFNDAITEQVRNAMAEKSIQLEKSIAELKPTVELDSTFDSSALDKLDAKLAEIENRLSKPAASLEGVTDQAAKATRENSSETKNLSSHVSRLSKVMAARESGDKKTPAELVGKMPLQFKHYLEAAQKQAYRGDEKAYNYMIGRARDVLNATGGGSFGADQNFDVRAMETAFSDIASIAAQKMSGEAQSSALGTSSTGKSSGTIQEEILKVVNANAKGLGANKDATEKAAGKVLEKLNEKPEPVGSLSLDMTTDAGKISGELFGNARFLRDLKDFVNRSTKNTARAVAS